MKSVRRGYCDEDERLFGASQREKLLNAATDIRWLLNRGYNVEPAITFTCNHYLLNARQRMAIFRSVISQKEHDIRCQKELKTLGKCVFVDGLNTIITLETALSHSLVLKGDDGVMRDVAGLHGTYRIIDKTAAAIDLIIRNIVDMGVEKATFFLDKPVSNSGSLKQLILERAIDFAIEADVQLVQNPDACLIGKESVISSDGPVIHKSLGWFNLNARIVEKEISDAWIFEFS